MINIDTSSLEAALKEIAEDACRNAAGRIRDELYEEAKLAIEDFYNSYNPIYYRRHYYNFYNKSFKKYYSNAHGTIYRGGIELTPENLDEIYKHPASDVFDSVYAGIHGPAAMGFTWHHPKGGAIGAAPITASPMETLLKKRDYIIDHIEDYL